MRADGLAFSVQKGMIVRYYEGGGDHGEGVEGYDSDGDFSGGHLHTFGVGEGFGFGGCGGYDVHSSVGKDYVDDCCPVKLFSDDNVLG